ncbi:ribulose-phosphate 3-epimerase [Sediminibacillus dalangtanensis]|uniref:Ribulose-phosphate 3-epimerase n=1 Tax=Sediminibacillus dalangtanensis TaxID=2729421 RepID=A0ABX7W0C5_9BACI|nr:ribulose-phosphate 3-epimerase [Sediminibacillus dalangtanensis]QTN00527.1 ribulose-phosphate 3-epimerase [Sediminibacillus dalangtanensis]
MAAIGPSLMCADMGTLQDTVKRLDQAPVDFFHFDIMDGLFVPNFTMGPDMIDNLRPHTNKLFDAHLMIEEPERYIDLFADAGCDMVSVHAEATIHLQRTLQKIKNRGLKAGVALNPATPLNCLEYVWDTVDYIVVMTVNPGFAGQKFIPMTLKKISMLNELIRESGRNIDIQVDGNISYEIIPEVLERGAEMLVCGTSCLFIKNETLEHATANLQRFLQDFEEKNLANS